VLFLSLCPVVAAPFDLCQRSAERRSELFSVGVRTLSPRIVIVAALVFGALGSVVSFLRRVAVAVS